MGQKVHIGVKHFFLDSNPNIFCHTLMMIKVEVKYEADEQSE